MYIVFYRNLFLRVSYIERDRWLGLVKNAFKLKPILLYFKSINLFSNKW